jgi:NitT/TauT family transport system substrate-binding protein
MSVIGYQDTTYYTLLGVLGTVGLKKTDVDIQALGPTGVVQLFIHHNVQGCACLPEWIVTAEDAGVKMNLMPSAQYVPSLAQAIVASDKIIKERPDVVRRLVQATLKAYVELRDHPVEAAKTYVAAVPAHKGKEAYFGRVYTYYSKFVWAGQKQTGVADPAVFQKVQDLYFDLGVIKQKTNVADLYTNEFAKPQ